MPQDDKQLTSRGRRKRRGSARCGNLRQSAEVLQTILDEVPVMISVYDESHRILFVNRTCEQVLGWGLEEVRRTDLLAECFPDSEYRAQVRDYMKEDTCEWRDVEMRRRDGSYLDSAWSNVSLSDGSRIGIGIDVSARKQAEAAVQQMSRRILEALEDDRQAVAKELHDGIGASLAAIKFSLEARVECMGRNPDPDKMSFEQIIAHLAQTIKETKRIAGRLRPSALDELGLVTALDTHLREFCEFYPDIQLAKKIEIEEQEVPESLKIVLYRVLQEALNNVGKHSGAATVNVKLVSAGGLMELTVKDDGCGFDPNDPRSETDPLRGYGLRSMRERVEICGGAFRIRSGVGEGCCVSVSLPLS